jgi:predicted dehydrogenase
MGRWHCNVAQSLGANVVAIVDSDLNAAKRLQAKALKAEAQQDISGLKKLSVKVAHVCTPTASHAETVLALTGLGIHSFVEKPLAETAEKTQWLLDMAKRSGVLMCPVHQYAFQPGMEIALRALNDLGSLRRIDFNICSAGAERGSVTAQGLLSEILPHPISMLQRLVPGAPLARLQWSVLRASQGDFLAIAKYDGVLISMSISANARPTRMTTLIQCDGGSIDIDGFHGYAVVTNGEVSKSSKITAPFSRSIQTLAAASHNLASRVLRWEPAYPGLRDLMRRFYTATLAGTPSPIDPATVLAAAVTRDILCAGGRDSPAGAKS